MFDMKQASGSNEGYKLVINYNALQDVYYLSGYVAFQVPDGTGQIKYSMDGAVLPFKTLKDALAHIKNYNHEKPLKLGKGMKEIPLNERDR